MLQSNRNTSKLGGLARVTIATFAVIPLSVLVSNTSIASVAPASAAAVTKHTPAAASAPVGQSTPIYNMSRADIRKQGTACSLKPTVSVGRHHRQSSNICGQLKFGVQYAQTGRGINEYVNGVKHVLKDTRSTDKQGHRLLCEYANNSMDTSTKRVFDYYKMELPDEVAVYVKTRFYTVTVYEVCHHLPFRFKHAYLEVREVHHTFISVKGKKYHCAGSGLNSGFRQVLSEYKAHDYRGNYTVASFDIPCVPGAIGNTEVKHFRGSAHLRTKSYGKPGPDIHPKWKNRITAEEKLLSHDTHIRTHHGILYMNDIGG